MVQEGDESEEQVRGLGEDGDNLSAVGNGVE